MKNDEFHAVLQRNNFVEVRELGLLVSVNKNKNGLGGVFLGKVHQERSDAQFRLVCLELLLVDEEHNFVMLGGHIQSVVAVVVG